MGAAQGVGTQHKALLQPQPHFLGMKMPEHPQVLDRLGVQPWAAWRVRLGPPWS